MTARLAPDPGLGDGGRGPARRWPAATNTIMDLQALAGGRLAFGAVDPAFGVFDANGRKQTERRGEVLDHRATPKAPAFP